MNLNPIKANMTEVTLENGNKILFSYKTPVAVYIAAGQHYIVTNKYWSRTTTRHINSWIAPLHYDIANKETQDWFTGFAEVR